MKDEYLMWKRVQDSSKQAIFDAEASILINTNIRLLAVKKIKELERAGKVPKLPKKNEIKTQTG